MKFSDDLNFIKSVNERDIDFLILEELSVSTEFQEWFASRVIGEKVFKTLIGAWHSVDYGSLGETDLLFIIESMDESRIGFLIENKIDANPQPQQGVRYQKRGIHGQKDGYWDSFKTCLIAPQRYLKSTKSTESYDMEISYEEIFSFYQSRSSRDTRFSYKANIVLEAIQKNRRGYQPEYDESNTTFVSDYYDYVMDISPELKMQKPKPRPAGSSWIMFYPELSSSRHIDFLHQYMAGKVKVLIFAGLDDFESIKEILLPVLPEASIIELLPKSVSVMITTAVIDPFNKSFQEQKVIVDDAVKKLQLLKDMLEKSDLD